MKHLLSAALLALAVPASAQQVVFQDGFEGGLGNWTATGLWNLESSADPCGSQAAPFFEGTQAAWYGVEGACHFDTGDTNSGSLVMNDWLALPVAPSINLRFWMRSESEYCWGGWDQHSVHVQAQGGPDAGFQQDLCDFNGPSWMDLAWHERRIDLSAYGGAQVRISFLFTTLDDAFNNGLGWFVDDVRILAEPGQRVCPSEAFDSDCPCMSPWIPVAGGCRNSTQQSATLLSQGSPAVAQDTLQFHAAHMPPGTLPTLFQSTAQIAPAAFGDGLRCTGGTVLRMGTLVAPNGTASWPAPGAPSLSVRGQVPPEGGTRYYQAIYRNALEFCTPATFNLTDAQRVLWLP
jgi:hypothetical protein